MIYVLGGLLLLSVACNIVCLNALRLLAVERKEAIRMINATTAVIRATNDGIGVSP